jgi:hypothetical protein
MWATILLSNVDTLEVFEEAIRQAGEQPPEEAPADQDLEGGEAAEGSSRLPSVQPPANKGNTNRRGGGRGPQPRPTKTQDKDKEQRKAEHNARWEAAAANRRAEGAAREAARQAENTAAQETANAGTHPSINTTPPATLPNLPLTPPTLPYNLPPPNTADPTVEPNLANPTGNDDDDDFFEPSQGEDEEHPEDALELDSQNDSNQSKTLSGTKELKENPPEDEASSAKKARKGATSGTPLNE